MKINAERAKIMKISKGENKAISIVLGDLKIDSLSTWEHGLPMMEVREQRFNQE